MPKLLTETKHFQAASQIRELVNTLSPGEVLPVASELMETLNISHGTAMRALKVLADEGVIVRPMGKLRYRIAERFERVSARISMVRPDFPSSDLDGMVQSVYEAGKKRNWKFNQYCFRKSDEVDFTRIMGEADAMVLIPTAEFISEELVRALLKPERPVAVLLQHLRHPGINNVCINDFRVGELAAETLFERGHRRILFVKDQPDETTMAERYRGFSAAAERFGIPCGGEWFLDTHIHAFEDGRENCYRALSELIGRKKPEFTAVFCASMMGGVAALRAVREQGLAVPDDIAVLAFGGESDLAPYLYPPLSCVEIHYELFGEYAARLLEAALSPEPSEPHRFTIEPRLVLRESI